MSFATVSAVRTDDALSLRRVEPGHLYLFDATTERAIGIV